MKPYCVSNIAISRDSNNHQSLGDLLPSACMVRAATRLPQPFQGYLSTSVCLTCLKKWPQYRQTCLALVEVQWWFISLLIKLSNGSENCILSLGASVDSFTYECITRDHMTCSIHMQSLEDCLIGSQCSGTIACVACRHTTAGVHSW